MQKRSVYYISDGTGITSETLGLSLISQFEGFDFTEITLPFIDSIEKAELAKQRINNSYETDQVQPLVFATFIDQNICNIISKSNSYFIDFFKQLIPDLEQELATKAIYKMGKLHSVTNKPSYYQRMEALNFALNYDDGARLSGYDAADIILIGVSRSGKTPTCIYLAMQYGIQAANFPLTEEDLIREKLPKTIEKYKHKLFGLTISPDRLQLIRNHRRPNSQYAAQKQCEKEIKVIEAMYQHEKIPFLNSTSMSIEELATKLMELAQLKRKLR